MAIETEVRKGWHDAIIEMYEIDLSAIGEDFSGQYFLTNQIMPDNSFVKWKGQTYTSFPIESTGFDINVTGRIPQPEITVANVFGTFGAAVASADDLVGAKVIRRRTLFKYLDNGPSPDSSQEFPEDIFYVERKIAENNLSITWQLASKIDLEGLLLPRRVISQNHCLWRYRGAECGYTGPPVANEFDTLPGGSSDEAQAYSAALADLLEANSSVISAQNELDAAQADKDIVCAIAIIQRGDPVFNLRGSIGPYTFGILDSSTYFAAYKDGEVITPDKFDYDPLSPEVGDAVMGVTQTTGRGPGNNGTGEVWSLNTWTGIAIPNPDDPEAPPRIEPAIVEEGLYNPPFTFAFIDLDGKLIVAKDGTIIAEEDVSLTNPGKTPSVELGKITYARGQRRENNVAPVVDLQIWEASSSQCDAATQRVSEAEQALQQAEADFAAAQSTFDAALAALPPDDPIFSNDKCGKRLTSCRLRFGLSTLPFGAFPGANLFR